MTATLEKAFKKACELPASMQEQLASQLLSDMEGEAAWDASLENSQTLLDAMAAKAAQAHRSGKTIARGFDEL